MNEFIARVRNYFAAHDKPESQSPRWLLAVMILAAALVWVCTAAQSQEATTELDERTTADTFIPTGFTLVPIEVENYQALDSILGQFGVVDLFTVPILPNEKPRRVATRIKILRAPQNPSHYAVLSRSEDAKSLVSQQGRFFVVVKNPKETGTEIEKQQTSQQRRSRITVETLE